MFLRKGWALKTMNNLIQFTKEYIFHFLFISSIFIYSLIAAESKALIIEIMDLRAVFALLVYVALVQLCLYKLLLRKEFSIVKQEHLLIASFLFCIYVLIFMSIQSNLFFLLILFVTTALFFFGPIRVFFNNNIPSINASFSNGNEQLVKDTKKQAEKKINSKPPNINVKNLIGRDIIRPTKRISEYISNKTVLITGAGGSIGSELVKQAAGYSPKRLILLGHGENSIFNISADIKEKFPKTQIHLIIADIQDKNHIEQIFEQYRPTIVFHAAAHKHVPLMEMNEGAAVRNNIFGTENLVKASSKYFVERFVFISTDKAVEPINIMGKTKRIGELIVQAAASESLTKFSIVRFGNVLESRGSVIPIFKKQIESGEAVTVTHPDMVRYFMTIPEAVQLVLEAGALSKGGEVFVLDMGKPVKIIDIARRLICLYGYEPDKDIRIEITGIRQGEKLNESLFYTSEEIVKTKHPNVMIAVPKIKSSENLQGQLEKLKEAVIHYPEKIGQMLDKIIKDQY
ncbi:polysaccharide biosynthesis protein [Bacillus sp. NTK034]|nr:polysaccharide biosynthesis protein [Bacillus sp. NTK034]